MDMPATPYKKPDVWSDPSRKPFPYQVGFTAPPKDFEICPSDFLRIAPNSVGISSRLLYDKQYSHSLQDRHRNFHLLEEVAACMADAGADVIAQVGTNWSHTGDKSPDEVREICERFSDTYETPFHMMGLSALDALLELGAEKIAMNTVYYWPDWTSGIARFLAQGGLHIEAHGNFFELGAYPSQEALDAENFVVPERVIFDTMKRLAENAPDVDAYYVTGVACFAPADGSPYRRIVHIERELEDLVGKPVIGSDTALYWRVFKTLGIAPVGERGTLLSSLQIPTADR